MQDSESLDNLATEAGQLDAQPSRADEARQQQQQHEQQQAQASNVGELLAAATMIRTMWLPLLPPHKSAVLAQVWNDQTLTQGAHAGAAVMELHGIRLGDVMGRYAPYVALLAALGPPVLATVQVMRAPDPQPATAPPPANVVDVPASEASGG
jgi:hypothetical protein